MQPESKSCRGTPAIHVPPAHTVVTLQFYIVLRCKERMQSITLYLKAVYTLDAPLLRTMKVRRGRRGHGESINDHDQKMCLYNSKLANSLNSLFDSLINNSMLRVACKKRKKKKLWESLCF